jgi:hypothetical protein
MLCLLIGIASMMFMPQVSTADDQQQAVVRVGQGIGHLTNRQSGYVLTARVKELGDYWENWHFPATTFDYRFAQPLDLARDVNRVSLLYRNPRDVNLAYHPKLRVLIEDQRGHLYAVGTRLGAKLSELPWSDQWQSVQSFDWTVNEMGRIDPWLMMRILPEKPDFYDTPQPPLKWVGLRMVVIGKGDTPCQLEVRELSPQVQDQKAEPYWHIGPDEKWNQYAFRKQIAYGRYGWGPDQPGPYLKAADLQLRSGHARVSWEVLAGNDWDVLASDQLSMDIKPDSVIQLPLLEAGTYRLKIHAVYDHGAVHQRYQEYVVIRNSLGSQADIKKDKPLQIHSSQDGNVFTTLANADIYLTTRKAGQIRWTLSRSNGQQVAEGGSSQVDLEPYFKTDSVLWLKAQLIDDGKLIDELDRVLGLRSPAPAALSPDYVVESKIKQFTGKLRRVKGDWNEGYTPVISNSVHVLKEFTGWLDDAVRVGYNIVELSAPWYDLSPLPGVYEFKYLDRLIDLAQQRGLKVTLRMHAMFQQVPGYVHREYMTDQAGFIHGLWSGTDKLLFSPAARDYELLSCQYMHAVASHYRNHPAVIGYTLESLYFDHDMIDMPWLGQSVDYSPAMRSGFIGWLHEKYGSLEHLNKAYETSWVHWEQIKLPEVRVKTDDDGRPMPHHEPIVRDWLNYKIYAISALRTHWLKTVRSADPGALIGMYNSASTEFYLDSVRQYRAAITYGSMEAQYPRQTRAGIAGRFEPHAKIARTSALVDVGLTNLLMIDQPGVHGLFNYWMPQWRLDHQPAPVLEAEMRLQTWFGFIDQLTQTRPLAVKHERTGAYLICDETLLYEFGHLFYDRINDYLKPFQHHVSASDMRVDSLHAKDLKQDDLKDRPWVYVPYVSDILSADAVSVLTQYVKQGGTLIMEAGSGKWGLADEPAGVLARAIGLGKWQARKAQTQSVSTQFMQCPVTFRTMPWNPPINNQPTPWIHNIAGGYLQLGSWGQGPTNQLIMQHPLGQGQVIAFGGVVDWLASPGLLACLQQTITGQTPVDHRDENIQLIKRQLVNGSTHYMVGRRFISQSDIEELKRGHPEKVDQTPEKVHVRLSQLEPTNKYQVTNLLDAKVMSDHAGKTLMEPGIELILKPGQAFVLKFEIKQD